MSVFNAACPYLCPNCKSMSMLHIHVHAACPCPYCRSMSMLLVHVHAAFQVYAACPCPCWKRTRTQLQRRTRTCRNASLSTNCSARYWNENKIRYRNRFRYHTKPTQFSFYGLVLDWNNRCRNADACVSFLDADAQLWLFLPLLPF